MNNIITNWQQILDFGRKYGLPFSKKKAILREYLQIKILDSVYRKKTSSGLIFVGGTALRLVRNLNRFSEDLDFDLSGIDYYQVDKLINQVYKELKAENINLSLYKNKTKTGLHHEFRFTDLLFKLGLNNQREEKLTIKFDYGTSWKNHTKEVVLINRYGFLIKSVTVPMDQLLVQKLTAYLNRKQTQPRDIYDIVWLVGHEAKLDREFMKKNKLSKDLTNKAVEKYNRQKSRLKSYQQRLKPFLIDDSYLDNLNLFPQLVKNFLK